ncbi:hypothetical protein EUX98_g4287 [Antrodiella citrinella]|uniref:L-ornithine N(5)-oxygenase n=1 Tax=Antrodiella citrinella TaxID=2447956 RepID=A0A4S4MUI7_9APHY|nr:hypothetical protein EUX98_g4287 [Antrodiella citrinella]
MSSTPLLGAKGSDAPKRVVVVGAGIGGITAGIYMKRDLKFHNFTVYETVDEIGGTWHFNTYPGAASDIATHWYSLSSDVDPDSWDRTHLTQPRLLAYWKWLTDKYGVDKHLKLSTKVTKVQWDEKKQIYHVHTRNTKTGETQVDYANAVISAIGLLNEPHHVKALDGIRTAFKGAHFHSARWDHSVDLHNKRVAVIGSGGSACQFIPFLGQDPTTKLVQFIRTPGWFWPDLRLKIGPKAQWAIHNIPFLKQLARYTVFFQHETLYVIFFLMGKTDFVRNMLIKHIKDNAPAEYADKLVPKHPSGCKRFIIDAGYLKSLHQDNCAVNFDGIAEVTATGIRTKTGENLDFDVIIEATGFQPDHFPLEVVGLGGKTMQDYFIEQKGPVGYLGTAAAGFPNFYTITGPNTTTGHGSVIFTIESQMTYINQMLEPVIKGQASSFVVTDKASKSYNEKLQKSLKASLWEGCASWYRTGHDGKISSIWPGFITGQWWRLRRPVWRDYAVTGGDAWVRRRRLSKAFSFITYTAAIVLVVWVGLNWDLVKGVFADLAKKVGLAL